MFKRNRDQVAPNSIDVEASDAQEGADSSPTAASDVGAASSADRSEGPWDASEAPADEMQRLDFGALQVPGVDGMNINLEMDEQSQQVVAITLVLGEGGIQLQPFAAPRSGSFWDEVRAELAAGISSSGGVVDEAQGALGRELRASVPATNEAGTQVMQQVRFVGIDGPRWLLRGVMLGIAAVDDRGAEVFEDILRGCIVTRGSQPMAPGDLLPLRLPPDALMNQVEGEEQEPEQQRPALDPFERGPEITEIH